MAGMKISELDFLRLLPAFMRDDEAAIALSKAVDQLVGDPGKRVRALSTWDSIDELNEAECDELAWELDIDWYDSMGMDLTAKRETIKSAQQIKRKRGTKWAVERLISAYFGDGYVQEWYELGDAPYTFRIMTTNPDVLTENFAKFSKAVMAAKNERSHMLGIFYYWPQGPDKGVECAWGTQMHRYDFDQCGVYPRPAVIGVTVDHSVETELETAVHRYSFTDAGEVKCGEDGIKATIGACVVGTAIVGKSILRD